MTFTKSLGVGDNYVDVAVVGVVISLPASGMVLSLVSTEPLVDVSL